MSKVRLGNLDDFDNPVQGVVNVKDFKNQGGEGGGSVPDHLWQWSINLG